MTCFLWFHNWSRWAKLEWGDVLQIRTCKDCGKQQITSML